MQQSQLFYLQCWLDHEKSIIKQVKDFRFNFAVKFFPPDPELLEEEFTRWAVSYYLIIVVNGFLL